MRKVFVFLFGLVFSFLTATSVSAQFTSYSKYDNEEAVVYDVEDMSSDEIKTYNAEMSEGYPKTAILTRINAGRAHTNLEYAPATIIEYNFFSNSITEDDSIPDAIDACGIELFLMNTTPKVIKEITLEFEFKKNGESVYDIKTGDKYCILKFRNLKGRTKSYLYDDIMETILNCFHILSFNDASYKKLFYNSKANTISLHRVNIKYLDGSVSNKAAIWDGGYSKDKLMTDGPLEPLISYLYSIKE